MLKLWTLLAIATLVSSGPSWSAPTSLFDEDIQGGGDLSDAAAAPVLVGTGFDGVRLNRDGFSDARDIFYFESLPAEDPLIQFDFSQFTVDLSPSYSAGAEIRYKESAFLFNFDGTFFGNFQLNNSMLFDTATLSIPGFSGGPLYVGVYFTNGDNFEVNATAPTAIAPVPAPSSLGLIAVAVGAMAWLRRRRPTMA